MGTESLKCSLCLPRYVRDVESKKTLILAHPIRWIYNKNNVVDYKLQLLKLTNSLSIHLKCMVIYIECLFRNDE